MRDSRNRFFFFAGGDYQSGNPNAFTSNFIRHLEEALGHRFSVIKGIYHPRPIRNVLWAIIRAQEPVRQPGSDRILSTSFNQIRHDEAVSQSQLVIVSSSYGSVVAAQVACMLAEEHSARPFLHKPFHLALGASMVSKESGLYRRLVHHQQQGIIDKLIYDELQDEGDNSTGIGGRTWMEACLNGLGICFPAFTRKYRGPSFLNNHPQKGHLHRVRAQSVQKAHDFRKVIFDDYGLGK